MHNVSKYTSENFSTIILEKLRSLAVGHRREQSLSVKKTYKEPLNYSSHSPVLIEVILKLRVIIFDRSYRKTNKQTNKQDMGLDIVLYSCYFRICGDPQETSTYPLELVENLIVLKTSTSTDVFRKLTPFLVLFMLSLCFYHSVNTGYYMKRNRKLHCKDRGHFNIEMAVAWEE